MQIMMMMMPRYRDDGETDSPTVVAKTEKPMQLGTLSRILGGGNIHPRPLPPSSHPLREQDLCWNEHLLLPYLTLIPTPLSISFLPPPPLHQVAVQRQFFLAMTPVTQQLFYNIIT